MAYKFDYLLKNRPAASETIFLTSDTGNCLTIAGETLATYHYNEKEETLQVSYRTEAPHLIGRMYDLSIIIRVERRRK